MGIYLNDDPDMDCVYKGHVIERFSGKEEIQYPEIQDTVIQDMGITYLVLREY